MKERSQLALLILILLAIGAVFAYFTINGSKFTFYKAEININGNIIDEKLYYSPNKAYHTLYRDFETPINPEFNTNNAGSIRISEVGCSHGTPYYKDYFGRQYIMAPYFTGLLTYTETNEYGCGFGDTLGFDKGKEYSISATYELHPDILIEYNGRYYTKFIAYSSYRHPLLNHKTMTVTGDSIYSKYNVPISDFMMYIPYEPKDITNYDIIQVSHLRTTDNMFMLIYYIIMALVPATICFYAWKRFGLENVEGDYPEELSGYPKERKAWEVAAYFHPPFGKVGNTFLPAVIMDFYNRKILDIKDIKKQTYIKIQNENPKVDEVENVVLDFLKDARDQSGTADGYFSLEKVSEDANKSISKARKMNSSYKKIQDTVTLYSNDYVDKKGPGLIILVMAGLLFLNIYIEEWQTILFYFISICIVSVVTLKSALLSRFKKDYYLEYQQWQGFKNYLSHLDSIPRTSYKGVVMWEKYLIYATSLGIGKKVLDALKRWKVIEEKQYHSYSIISLQSFSPSLNTGSGGHRGGFGGGGMGGGGIGGGGGGGR